MRGLFARIVMTRGIASMRRGLYEGLLVVLGASAVSAFALWIVDASEPNSGLLQTLAQIGATLLIAYVLEVSWLIGASRARPQAERDERVGALLAIGAGALVSMVLAIVLAGRADASNWIWLDRLALGLVVGPIFMTAVTVALQPLMTHEWLDENRDASGAAGTRDELS